MSKLYREVKPSEGQYALRPVDPENAESVLTFIKPIEITEEEIWEIANQYVIIDEYYTDKGEQQAYFTKKGAAAILSKLKGE
jgi:hypothetical protein